MLKVALVAAGTVPAIITEDGKLHVGLSAVRAPVGLDVREQVRSTLPVNPPEGVTVMVEDPLPPTLEIVTGVAAMLNEGELTVTTTDCAVALVKLKSPLYVKLIESVPAGSVIGGRLAVLSA